jgi:hypothetical protein
MKLINSYRIPKIVCNSGKDLYNLSDVQILKVKSDLTFTNPEFARIKKYSKYSSTNVPPYLFYYEDHGDFLRVPFGYDTSFIKAEFGIS